MNFVEIIVYNVRAEIKRQIETFFNLIWQLKFFTMLLMPTHNWESATHTDFEATNKFY